MNDLWAWKQCKMKKIRERRRERGEMCVSVSNWTDLKKLKIVFSFQKVYQNFDWDSVIGVDWKSPFLLEVFFKWD